jgi:hypothetical protein
VTPRTSSNPRKVSFQDDSESDSLYRPPPAAPVASKQSKWEPLSTLDPSPVADDPFSLGDSDEERESKVKDTKGSDPERVKEATAAAMAEDIGGSKKVEDKLTGK